MSVVDASYDNPLKPEEHATNPFAGGLANQGYQCGMLWGAALAAGARSYQLYGSGMKAESEAMIATKNLVKRFRDHTKNEINCMEITELDMQNPKGIFKFLIKGGPIRCFRLAGKYAQDAFEEINTSFSKDHNTPIAKSFNCASILAKKMGASDMHATLVAGLAGGIGFSGGACGALGVAIWYASLKTPEALVGFNPMDSWIGVIAEEFLKSSDYEFECSEIVGRLFEGVEDHAEHVSSGGCSNIIEALVAQLMNLHQH